MKKFYSAIIESVLCTSIITVWFSSATKSDLRRLQGVVRTTANHWYSPPYSPRTVLIQSEQRAVKNHSGPLTSSTLPSWSVTVGSTATLQSSEQPEGPDIETVSSLRQSISWTLELLTINMKHLHYNTFIYYTRILITFKFSPNIPVHTKLSILYIVFGYFCTLSILYICILLFLLSMSCLVHCHSVTLWSLCHQTKFLELLTYLAIKLILLLRLKWYWLQKWLHTSQLHHYAKSSEAIQVWIRKKVLNAN